MEQQSGKPTVPRLVSEHGRSDDADRSLAAWHIPLLLCDRRDPFTPTAVGYRVVPGSAFAPAPEDGTGAPSTPSIVIEYAIWWDWSLSALGSLQRVRVFLDEQHRVMAAQVRESDSTAVAGPDLRIEGGHVMLQCDPVLHSLAAGGPPPAGRNGTFRNGRNGLAGRRGVQVIAGLHETARVKTPQADRLAHTYLSRLAFEPSFDCARAVHLDPAALVPWPALAEWIPRRMAWWIGELERRIPPEERRFLRVAHRGASAHAPENTLAAIVKAAELGADMVELDVHCTEDAAAVILHDAEVSRTTNGNGFVYSMRLEELKQLDAGRGESIPTLAEAIACCRDNDLGMYLELKSDFAAQLVVAAIQAHELHGNVVVASFRPDWLAEVKSLDATIPTAVLFSSAHVDPVALAQAVGATYVHPCWEYRAAEPHRLLTPEWLRCVRAAGLGVVSWHEERPNEIAALRRLGVDAICTNAPEMLL
jgi:glycerophosphoryl diester phosphodiesterase